MILFLSAQDLHSIWLGLIGNSTLVVLENHAASPEQYLSTLDQFLSHHRLSAQELEGICLVTGPGSFTSSRVSLTIANTLQFVHQIPLFTLENPDHLSPRELLLATGLGNPVTPGDFAHVFYERPPHITSPRGDK